MAYSSQLQIEYFCRKQPGNIFCLNDQINIACFMIIRGVYVYICVTSNLSIIWIYFLETLCFVKFMHVFQLNLNKTGTHFMSVAALLWMGTIAALPLLGMGTIANNDVA